MKKMVIKDWFQNKVSKEMGIRVCGFTPVAVSKESEKAYYITMIYCTLNGGWHQKSMWIPKSCIEESDKVNEVKFVESYEEASAIAQNEIAMAS